MRESEIINYIKHLIACRYKEAGDNYLTADDVIVISAAVLFPYMDGYTKNSSDIASRFGSIVEFENTLKKWIVRKKGRLSHYTKDALMECFRYEWLHNLNIGDKRKLLKWNSLIDSVEDNGFVNFKKDKVMDTFAKMECKVVGDGKYGDEDYVRQEEIVRKDHTETPQNASRLEEIWAEICSEDFFKGENPFVWSLDLPYSTYCKLKEALKEAAFCIRFLSEYADILATYLALWFHWEYNGNDGKSALKDIGISNISPRDIFTNAGIDKLYRYEGDNNTMHQDSLYVLGGLPLNYIYNRHERFRGFFKTIWKLKKAEFDESDIVNLAVCLGNTIAYKGSLENGSLHEYVKEIISDRLHIADEDKNNHLVSNFVQLINNGKKEYYKFSAEWLFYTDDTWDEYESACRIKFGYGKDEGNIPYFAFSQWAISDEMREKCNDNFKIGLEIEGEDTKSSRTIRYSRQTEKNFVSWGASYYLTIDFALRQDLKILVKLYALDDVKCEHGVTIEEIAYAGYCQLYLSPDNPYEWTSIKPRQNDCRSVIVYWPAVYKLEQQASSVGEKVCEQGGETIAWYEFSGETTLLPPNNGSPIVFRKSSGTYEILFNPLPCIHYQQVNKIRYCCKNEDEENVEFLPLLLGKKGMKFVFYPFEKDDTPPNPQDVSCKFRQGDGQFVDFSTNNPQTGKIRLRMEATDGKKEADCFYINYNGDKQIILRDCDNGKVVVRSGGADVRVPNSDGDFVIVELDKFGKYNIADNEFDRKSDVLPVRIGTEEEYAEIEVFRPWNCKELYLNQELLTRIEEDRTPEIPVILRNKFHARIINEYGIIRVSCDRPFFFDATKRGENPKEEQFEGVKLKYYIEKKSNTIPPYPIKKGKEQMYHFFYWNLNSDCPEEELETSYDEETEMLSIPLEKLSNGGMIFQSLKDEEWLPEHYYSAIYPDDFYWNYISNKNFRNDKINLNLYVACFNMACKHHVYFSRFYPLLQLKKPEDMIEFFVAYYCSKQKHLSDIDYKELHRFANEFLFDWILLPLSEWKKVLKKPKIDFQVVKKLFLTSPFQSKYGNVYLEQIVEQYLQLPTNFRRSQFNENKFLQCIRSKGRDCKILGNDKEGTIKLLGSLHNDKDLFQKVYELIEKQNKKQ